MKKIHSFIKIQIPAGNANPSPPIGPALGQKGINIIKFCQDFNEKTKNDEKGLPIPVVITVYHDKTFTFITKKPPVAVLLKKEIGISLGSKTPGKNIVGAITIEQIRKIAKIKHQELTGSNIEKKCLSIIGTAHSMGIEIKNNELNK